MKKNIYKALIILVFIIIIVIELKIIIKKKENEYRVTSYYTYSSTHNYFYKPLIIIPSINLKQLIAKADSDFSNLDNSLVYYQNFDPRNKIIIFGHSGSGYGTYFNRLDELSKNDYALVYYKDICYKYEFYDKKYINENDVDILKKDGDGSALYLITCIKKAKDKRLLVVLKQKNSANARKIRKK